MELALSFTLESKPVESTPRNHLDSPSAVVTLATSTATIDMLANADAITSTLPFGMPKVFAMSLPVPHGSTPRAAEVPITPWSTALTVPSPPQAITKSATSPARRAESIVSVTE
jgi:hypothetical protein